MLVNENNQNIEYVERLVQALFEDSTALEQAIADDGWPLAMAREGLSLHRRTWHVERLVDALESELQGYGGLAALERFVEASEHVRARILRPERVVHIWPALPGAGVTPVLFGALLGIEQIIRPSRRGINFARYFADVSGIALMDEDQAWHDGDVVVVSGSDETIEALSRELLDVGKTPSQLIGYGHRVSFAVVVDDEEGTAHHFEAWADALAADIVMWHQRGCFSPRGVIFCGSETRSTEFAKRLGEAIAHKEHQWHARELDEATLAQRAQARGVAQFVGGELYGDGVGWVQLAQRPFRGELIATHTVSLHRVDSYNELTTIVQLPKKHIQGAALAIDSNHSEREQWLCALANVGVTQISKPGQMQSPSAHWLHDGRPNVTGWLRFCIEA